MVVIYTVLYYCLVLFFMNVDESESTKAWRQLVVGSACSGRLEGGIGFFAWKRVQGGRVSFRTPILDGIKDLSHSPVIYR